MRAMRYVILAYMFLFVFYVYMCVCLYMHRTDGCVRIDVVLVVMVERWVGVGVCCAALFRLRRVVVVDVARYKPCILTYTMAMTISVHRWGDFVNMQCDVDGDGGAEHWLYVCVCVCWR